MRVTVENSIQRNDVLSVLRKDDYKSRSIFTKISLKNKSEMDIFFLDKKSISLSPMILKDVLQEKGKPL